MDIYGSTFINKDEIFCVQKSLHYNEVYYPTALLVKEFLFERQILVLEHPPYLLPDFFIFQRWKFFRNIQNTLEEVLIGFFENDFQRWFQAQQKCWNGCLKSGDHIHFKLEIVHGIFVFAFSFEFMHLFWIYGMFFSV